MTRRGQLEAKPYKGPEYYRVEDRHLFHGRASDAAKLGAMVLSHRLCLLHATSGAGKTSLLHAEVMPAMEDRGWIAVRSLPQDMPEAALKAAVLFRVLPDPRLEIAAIKRALVTVRPHLERPDSPELRELRAALHDRVAKDSLRYTLALRPMRGRYRTPAGEWVWSDDVTPFFTRFCHSRRGPLLLARHIHALSQFIADPPWPGLDADDLASALATTSVPKLIDFFRRPELLDLHREMMTSVGDPELPLVDFLDRLRDDWGTAFDHFGLILILDQFEELFTRFVDQKLRDEIAKDPNLPDWNRRHLYFAALGNVLSSTADPEGASAGSLPLRILISMRDDFIADIDQLEARTGRIAREARYHLDLLDVEDCKQVIGAPAAAFGYTYDDNLLEEMLEALPTEESLVEPGHIQIVCERLWEEFGRRIRKATRAEGTTLPRIGHDDVAGENWVRDILGSHFDDFLNTCGDVLDRIEILDMLEPLITLGRTRNIVEQGQVIGARFRRSDLRTRLLEQLRRARIVRVEARLGGRFVEITHEFLIGPVMEARQAELGRNQKWRDLRAALQRLERIERAGFRGASTERLDPNEVAALDWYRDRLDTGRRDGVDNGWITELVVRSAALLGLEPAFLQRWGERLDGRPLEVDGAGLLDELVDRAKSGRWLDHLELVELSRVDPKRPLDGEQARFVLASALRNTSFAATRNVTAWVLEHSHAS